MVVVPWNYCKIYYDSWFSNYTLSLLLLPHQSRATIKIWVIIISLRNKRISDNANNLGISIAYSPYIWFQNSGTGVTVPVPGIVYLFASNQFFIIKNCFVTKTKNKLNTIVQSTFIRWSSSSVYIKFGNTYYIHTVHKYS